MRNVLVFFKKTVPFLMTLFLWRLSVYFWNPAGILCLIPIFYYTFVRPVNFFPLFGLMFCFLIDYRCNLPLFWTCLYCLFYAINGFQNYIDFQHMENNSLYGFMFFFGIGVLFLMFYDFSWINIINSVWLLLWLNVLYIPITSTDNWIKS